MKALKTISIISISFAVIFIFTATSYSFFFSQDVIKPYEINNPELEKKILIATQGSKFKNSLVEEIISELKEKSIYISIIDVSELKKVNESIWNVIIIINTCQSGKLQPDVENFMTNTSAKERIVLLTTSGSGKWKPENSDIDTISSASRKKNISELSKQILVQIDKILKTY